MPSFMQDLRYAFRSSLKAPAATFVAVLALAFGIGVNVSAFISVNGIMLHPMPFAHLDRLLPPSATNRFEYSRVSALALESPPRPETARSYRLRTSHQQDY